MNLTNQYKRIPVEQIKVERDKRQRRELDVTGLLESVRKFGVINPLVVTRELVLVAGERRLEASKQTGWRDVPCRFIDELSPEEAQMIELEENLKRLDLTWRDQARAIGNLHEIYQKRDENWTRAKTAEAIGVSPQLISQTLRVFDDIANPKIESAQTLTAAYNILSRADDRKIGDALSNIISAGAEIFNNVKSTVLGGGESPTPAGEAPSSPKAAPVGGVDSVLNSDFLTWAPAYRGSPFNFIHCDFPYGINVFGGEMSGKNSWKTYNDDPEVYWKLIKCLCANLDRVMAHSGHLMFWMSMEHYWETLEAFREHAPSLEFSRFPLIWLKSDNMGILPDAKRGPRRIYETALVASREDKLIVQAVSNGYAAPTDKAHHPSTKPEPVLRHFFRMFVDESTSMLDPTCGSGSSLRAAESLGANRVLGLEIDPEYHASARSALQQFRVMRKASK